MVLGLLVGGVHLEKTIVEVNNGALSRNKAKAEYIPGG